MLENVGSRLGVGPTRLERFSSHATPATQTNAPTANKRIRIAAPRRSNEQAPGAEASRVPQGMIFFRSKNREISDVALCASWRRAFEFTARVNVLSSGVISERKSIKRNSRPVPRAHH